MNTHKPLKWECKAWMVLLLLAMPMQTIWAQMEFSFAKLSGVTIKQLTDGSTLVELPVGSKLTDLASYGMSVTVDGKQVELTELSPKPASMEIEDLEDPHEAEEVFKYINLFRDKKIELSKTDEELWVEIRNGKRIISIDNIPGVLRLLLRGLLWCRLVTGGMKLYTGYDFYMYCECDSIPDEIIGYGKHEGIFVEYIENDR